MLEQLSHGLNHQGHPLQAIFHRLTGEHKIFCANVFEVLGKGRRW
jgi:hypothetical protein